MLVAACGPSAVKEKPDVKALTGTYEAKLEDGRISTLTIYAGGAITGSTVPVERFSTEDIDYRAIQSTWELVDPSMTPSGSWCVEFEGLFLRVYKEGSHLILRHPYDVTHHKTAIYTPKEP